MYIVGLTGNVAAGKSAVARIWREAGVPVVSADELAREAVAPGSSGLEAVVEEFGPHLILEDGTLDRPALRTRVFGDPEARRKLEEILHPRIQDLRDAWLDAQDEKGEPLVVAEIPLLYEVAAQGEVDGVVLVDAPEPLRLDRMMAHRGLTREESLQIMAAQMDPRAKRRQADWILENDGSLELLHQRAERLLESIRREVGGS
ncbi:MAG: dephospho-CoA kinase [Gemmatimonadota bacterium]